MGGCPFILSILLESCFLSVGLGSTYHVATPDEASNEENHSYDGEETTNEINLFDDFSVGQTR